MPTLRGKEMATVKSQSSLKDRTSSYKIQIIESNQDPVLHP